MSEKYFFNEDRDNYTYHEVLIDCVAMLEDRKTKYSRGFGSDSKVVFAYKDAIDAILRVEEMYMKKEGLKTR